jgi:hypothetical protein
VRVWLARECQQRIEKIRQLLFTILPGPFTDQHLRIDIRKVTRAFATMDFRSKNEAGDMSDYGSQRLHAMNQSLPFRNAGHTNSVRAKKELNLRIVLLSKCLYPRKQMLGRQNICFGLNDQSAAIQGVNIKAQLGTKLHLKSKVLTFCSSEV